MNSFQKLPTHVALIPDGNRRWARERGLPTLEGHRRGLKAVDSVVKRAWEMGIRCMSLWGFSTENWDRSKEEIDYLMGLFALHVDANLKTAKKNQARLVHLGRKDRLPRTLQDKIARAEEQTQVYTDRYLAIALDYGGRDEIVRAVSKLCAQKDFRSEEVNDASIAQHLDTQCLPQQDPDLIIRTGGELRLSGFMCWQSAYSELLFVQKYLPDFTVADFAECIRIYTSRERRFGK